MASFSIQHDCDRLSTTVDDWCGSHHIMYQRLWNAGVGVEVMGVGVGGYHHINDMLCSGEHELTAADTARYASCSCQQG